MASLLANARLLAQRLGVDVQRYPESDPLWRLAQLLRGYNVSAVLDVGANDGGYGRTLRRLGYGGTIWSFEPVQEVFLRLRATASRDKQWHAVCCALGAEPGRVQINVAGNNGASSSILPMSDVHQKAAPASGYIRREEVEVQTLDAVAAQLPLATGDNVFLKLDVQGYERVVLDGADILLRSERLVGVQMELSFTTLYEGGMTFREGLDKADSLGMELVDLVPGFAEPAGRRLQADAIFFRA